MKKLICRMLCMCDRAYIVFKYSLILSAVMLFCALIVLLQAQGMTAHSYELHRAAAFLYETPAAILLVASIASVVIEDRETGGK